MTLPGPLVLVVDDEPPVRRFLRASLGSHGYRVLEASSIDEATRMATSHRPDLILLDLGLPDGDGIAFTRSVREWSSVPILVVSARGREEDKVIALDAGADDYLTKPFGTDELQARMRVALRNAERAKAPTEATVIESGDLRIDVVRRQITRAGREIHLTPIEYKILVLLAKNAGRVLTHGQILHHVWGSSSARQTHYVRVHMAELRKKIEDDTSRSKILVTEPGVGYRFREIPPAA